MGNVNYYQLPITYYIDSLYRYFPDWKEWFEWTSSVFFPTSDPELSLGLSANSLGNRTYGFPSSDNWQDDGTSYQCMTQFKIPVDGNQLHRMSYPGVIADTYSVLGSNILSVEISDNDYKTFTTLGSIDLGSMNKTLSRAGAYRERVMRLTSTNDKEVRLHAFVANVS